jgi:hypothetical protein
MAATVGGYAWLATGLRPFTLPPLVAILFGGGMAVAVGAGLLPMRRPPPARPRHLVIWAALGAALALWELAAFLQHPRADHPTLSSLTDAVFQSHPARAVGLLAWLAVGAGLARR